MPGRTLDTPREVKATINIGPWKRKRNKLPRGIIADLENARQEIAPLANLNVGKVRIQGKVNEKDTGSMIALGASIRISTRLREMY